MNQVIKSLNNVTIGFLAILSVLFFHQGVFADAPSASEKAEQFRQLINQGQYKATYQAKKHSHSSSSSSSSSEELSIGILSLLLNFSEEPISGTVKVTVYNPEGKHTFLGWTNFSLDSGDSTPIIFYPQPIEDSDEHGTYLTVIDIYTSGNNDLFGLGLFGEVLAYNPENPEGTAVNFFDIDFISPVPNFQITVPYVWHRQYWVR